MMTQAALAMWMATIVRIMRLIQHGVRAISAMMISPLRQCAVLAAVAVPLLNHHRSLLNHHRSRQTSHPALMAMQKAPVMWMATIATITLPIHSGAWVTLVMRTSLHLQCAARAVAVQQWKTGFIEHPCFSVTGQTHPSAAALLG